MKKLLGIVVLGLILAINVEAQETKKLPDISVYDQVIQESLEGKCGYSKRHEGPVAYIKCLNGELASLNMKTPSIIIVQNDSNKTLKKTTNKEEKKKEEDQLAKEKKEKEANERAINAIHESNKIMFKGVINEKLVCPHCQSKGTVRTERKRVKEETRQKGIIGATIGMKTVTDKGMITKLSCDSCEMQWTS